MVAFWFGCPPGASVRQAESQASRLATAEKSNSQELFSKPPVSRNLKSLQTRL